MAEFLKLVPAAPVRVNNMNMNVPVSSVDPPRAPNTSTRSWAPTIQMSREWVIGAILNYRRKPGEVNNDKQS